MGKCLNTVLMGAMGIVADVAARLENISSLAPLILLRIWTLSRVERSRLTAAGWGAAGHTRWRPRFGQWVQEAVCLFPSHLRHPIIGDVKVCHLGLTRYLPVTHSV